MCNTIEEEDEGHEGRGVMITTEVTIVETTMKRENKRISKTDMDEATIIEVVVVQIVQMSNVAIANMNTKQRIATLRRR